MYPSDTIAAVSTPVGEGGIAIIRLSGQDSLCILKKIFKRKNDGGFLSHRFYYGEVVSPDSLTVIDDAMCVYMKAPRSFTCEDVVEIQCHGGTLIVEQILQIALHMGARLADPGEFTRRAFLNGRIDLVQAEAVIDLIRGKTETSIDVARQQTSGALSSSLVELRDHIRHSLALVEAYIDFPDEDIGEDDQGVILKRLAKAISLSDSLVATYEEGRVLRDGVSVMIAGKPNVGKSSLLNTLLREKRAIVTSIPGTTRDLIEEVINIKGLPVKLLDTAGIRNSDDTVEQMGVDLALARISSADLILFVVDASSPFTEEDRHVYEAISGRNILVVFNKSDLPSISDLPDELLSIVATSVSTLTGSGIEELKAKIADTFLHGKAIDSRNMVFLTKARHRDTLKAVSVALKLLSDSPDKLAQSELASIDLRDSLDLLGSITGETTPDDILDLIFGQFCIGK